MMRKLPIYIIGISILFILGAHKAYASTAFSFSGDSNSLTFSANSDTSQTTYEVTINATGPVTFNTSSVSFSGGVCNAGYPHSFVYSQSGGSVTAPVTVFCSTSAGTKTTGGVLFTLPISVNADQQTQISIDHNASNTTAANVGVPDQISSFGGTMTLNGNSPTATPSGTPSTTGTNTPTPTAKVTTTVTTTTTKNAVTRTTTPTATPLSVTGPDGFQAHPVNKPTITTANQPSLVVVTQPPYKAPPTPSALIQQTTNSSSPESVQTLVQGYFNNTAAAALFVIPILILLIMVAFMSIRMFQMNRRRQREVELLFEHELGELAALESKMDILNEKGNKGREDFKQEFERTKDQILKEIRPDYIGSEGVTPQPAT